MNPLNLRAPDMLSVGSRLTKLEAHITIISTFDKFALKKETREGILKSLLKLLHPEDSLPKDTKHLLSYNEGCNIKEEEGAWLLGWAQRWRQAEVCRRVVCRSCWRKRGLRLQIGKRWLTSLCPQGSEHT